MSNDRWTQYQIHLSKWGHKVKLLNHVNFDSISLSRCLIFSQIMSSTLQGHGIISRRVSIMKRTLHGCFVLSQVCKISKKQKFMAQDSNRGTAGSISNLTLFFLDHRRWSKRCLLTRRDHMKKKYIYILHCFRPLKHTAPNCNFFFTI